MEDDVILPVDYSEKIKIIYEFLDNRKDNGTYSQVLFLT